MPGRVPILRQDHSGKFFHQRIDAGHDLIAAYHRKRTAGAKIILDVDDNQGFIGSVHRISPVNFAKWVASAPP